MRSRGGPRVPACGGAGHRGWVRRRRVARRQRPPIHQFAPSNANQRSDGYGGTIANRIRFAVEVAIAVADEIGADRTGLRLSPANPYNDITENDTHDLYPARIDALTPLNLAYLHLIHAGDEGLRKLRAGWATALLLNRAGQTPSTAWPPTSTRAWPMWSPSTRRPLPTRISRSASEPAYR
ncbi:hypothetical protein [Kribbella sp. CA-294648]|uniref:oxidoreductase n=1 Tax=Kribbella sp. CA-294648 TaxID=3239948 RepID=UPI003D91835F